MWHGSEVKYFNASLIPVSRTTYFLQAGLAPMKRRLFRETVGRYGFKKEFALATAETMRDMLTEINKRLVQMQCTPVATCHMDLPCG